VLGGTTVLPWNRGTSFSRYQYRRGYGTTVVGYCNTTNTAVLPYGTSQQLQSFERIFSCEKKQFIDRVNKLEVFKLYVDEILVQLVSDWAALCVSM